MMFTVYYTVAKTIKGEFKNLYKKRNFASFSKASAFKGEQDKKPNTTDVRVQWS